MDIASVFRSKRMLRSAGTVLLGLVVGYVSFMLITKGLFRIRFESQTEAEQLTRQPRVAAVLKNDVVLLSHTGDSLGILYRNSVLFSEDERMDHLVLFGWIWAESVTEHNGTLILKTDENIRDRAQGQRLGRLKRQAVVQLVSRSDNKRWCFFRSNGFVGRENLKPLTPPRTFTTRLWDWLTTPRPILTVTTRRGGENVNSSLLETIPVIVLGLLTAVASVIRGSRLPETTKEKLLVEGFKAVVGVITGVLLAVLLFGLGVG
jgi:hypothetical protein